MTKRIFGFVIGLFVSSVFADDPQHYFSVSLYNVYAVDTNSNSYLYLREGNNAIVNIKYSYTDDKFGLFIKGTNKYDVNKFEIDYITATYYSRLTNNISIENKIGIVDSYDGFFTGGDTLLASGMLVLPLGVYNYKYTGTYLGNVLGYKGEIDYTSSPLSHKVILVYGAPYVRDEDRAIRSSMDSTLDGIDYQLEPLKGIGYVGAYGYYSAYVKWSSFDYKFVLTGDPYYVYQSNPVLFYLAQGNNKYNVSIIRKGISYTNYKWELYAEAYNLFLKSYDNKFGNEFDSAGYYVMARRNFNYQSVFVGYSEAKQVSSERTSTDLFAGLSCYINPYTTVSVEYHKTDSFSWVYNENNTSPYNETIFLILNMKFEKFSR